MGNRSTTRTAGTGLSCYASKHYYRYKLMPHPPNHHRRRNIYILILHMPLPRHPRQASSSLAVRSSTSTAMSCGWPLIMPRTSTSTSYISESPNKYHSSVLQRGKVTT